MAYRWPRYCGIVFHLSLLGSFGVNDKSFQGMDGQMRQVTTTFRSLMVALLIFSRSVIVVLKILPCFCLI